MKNAPISAVEHDQRMTELREIQEGLEKNNNPNLYVTTNRLARVIELLLQELS